MVDRRRSNTAWHIADDGGVVHDTIKDGVMLAVLMDIRTELQIFNSNISTCRKFLQMPNDLKAIRRNTTNKEKA